MSAGSLKSVIASLRLGAETAKKVSTPLGGKILQTFSPATRGRFSKALTSIQQGGSESARRIKQMGGEGRFDFKTFAGNLNGTRASAAMQSAHDVTQMAENFIPRPK